MIWPKLEESHDFFIEFRGGFRIFSRGGGRADFQKNFENFVDLFLGRPNWPKKAFLGTFWKTLTEKSRFFRRAFPPQN